MKKISWHGPFGWANMDSNFYMKGMVPIWKCGTVSQHNDFDINHAIMEQAWAKREFPDYVD